MKAKAHRARALIAALASLAAADVDSRWPAKPWPLYRTHAPRGETCVFILSTPGSGSSTMVELFNRYTACEISGENAGEFIDLARFVEDFERTDVQDRGNGHAERAWHKVYDRDAVVRAQEGLVRTMLNPRNATCWGFKEIRYGRDARLDTFAHDVAFLSAMCEDARVILHSRAALEPELESSVMRGKGAEARRSSAMQRACFDVFAKGAQAAAAAAGGGRAAVAAAARRADEIVVNASELSERQLALVSTKCDAATAVAETRAFRRTARPLAFRHTLDDYLENSTRYAALWDYVGLPRPPDHGPLAITTPHRTESTPDV